MGSALFKSSHGRSATTPSTPPTATVPSTSITSADPWKGANPALKRWRRKDVFSLVKKKKIAPLAQGRAKRRKSTDVECPVCFLLFDRRSVNQTFCCSQPICTGCYLSIKSPTTSKSCIFCADPTFAVTPSSSRTRLRSCSASTEGADESDEEKQFPIRKVSVVEREELTLMSVQQQREAQSLRAASFSGSVAQRALESVDLDDPVAAGLTRQQSSELEEMMLQRALAESLATT